MAADSKVNEAKNILLSAQDELSFKKAGSAPEQISAQESEIRRAKANISVQESQIKQAQANVKNIQAQLEKTILRSPIEGTIAQQDIKIGEIVSQNASVIYLISEARFEIEANVAEADIAKIKIGNNAEITLDAYGSDVFFKAKIIAVDPAETIIEGVATYKTTLEFVKEDERIKSGMTANIDIASDKRENVIIIPQRALTKKNSDQSVKILGDKGLKEVKVKTGLNDSDGNIEIIEGVAEGDKIIISSLSK